MSDHRNHADHDGRDRPPRDLVSWILADGQRRVALSHLREQGQTTLDELSEYLVDHAGSANDDPRRVRTSFSNHHIPMMQRAGLVEYDETGETLSMDSVPVEVDDLLSTALDADASVEE